MERVHSSSLPPTSKITRSFLEHSRVVKTVLKVVGVLGVSLVMSGQSEPASAMPRVWLMARCRRNSHTRSIGAWSYSRVIASIPQCEFLNGTFSRESVSKS